MSLGLQSRGALADEPPAERIFFSLAFYAGQGVDHNLLEPPGHILSGDIEWENSCFGGFGLSNTFGTLGESI